MDPINQLKNSLADHYIIEREIGAGGMATVYLARDIRHDRSVALKVLRPDLGAILGVGGLERMQEGMPVMGVPRGKAAKR